MKKICILIPYYGEWPVFLDLFLKGCSFNPELNVLFITDLELPEDCPVNVKKIHFTFKDLRAYIIQKLQNNVALKSYYKLCDLKPMYGLIFGDYVKDYQFWGFGDIDLIYGNTGKFITEEILGNFDVITFRTEWLSGALTLLRNNEYVNVLYQNSPDWLKVITTDKHYSFTECAGYYNAILNGVSIFDINSEITSMTAVCKTAAFEGKLRYYEKKIIKESISKGVSIEFNKGEIKDSSGKEYLLYHYISDKPKPYFVFPKWKTVPDRFYITQTGFYSPSEFKYEFFVKKIRYMATANVFGKKIIESFKASF